jgi:hypothetical protein
LSCGGQFAARDKKRERALRHQPEIAAGELERRALGLPRIAKQPAFQRIEAVRRRGKVPVQEYWACQSGKTLSGNNQTPG